MPRYKRENRLLQAIQLYLSQKMPELRDAPLQVRRLDGPPESPRYAATAEICDLSRCPRALAKIATASSDCGVLDCPLRCSMRLLLDQRGGIIQATRSGIHWS